MQVHTPIPPVGASATLAAKAHFQAALVPQVAAYAKRGSTNLRLVHLLAVTALQLLSHPEEPILYVSASAVLTHTSTVHRRDASNALSVAYAMEATALVS